MIRKNYSFFLTAIVAVVLFGTILPVAAEQVTTLAADSIVTVADSVVTADDDPAYAAAVAALAVADAADTVVTAEVPEWYVAPEIAEKHRTPRKAKGKSCPVDSVCTYDVNEQLSLVSAYDYDAKDSVIRETKWEYKNGVRTGISRQEFGYDDAGRQNMSAIYEWVSASRAWKGTEKVEYVYETYVVDEEKLERIIKQTDYAWVNDDWVADKRYTHEFDEQNRENVYTTETRNAQNQLVLSSRWEKNWDAEDRLILDVQYTAHDGADWSKGTKKIWAYDANGNKTEYTEYASIVNRSWVGKTRELWTYDAVSNQKTKYEKYTWSNGWVGSSKDEWGYTDGQLTMHATYKWGSTDWVGDTKEEWKYESGKKTLYATYTWVGTKWQGVNKEEWEFASGKDKRYEKFTWENNDWKSIERKDWTYASAGLTLYEYKKLESGSWVTYEQEKYEYNSSKKTTLHEKYERKNGVWTGLTKETWAYNASNLPTRHITFAWANGDWVNAAKEEWEYNSNKKTTLHETFSWTGDWVLQEQENWEYNSNKLETNYEKYAWESGVKTGKDKHTTAYTGSNKTEYITFVWENNDWVGSTREVWGYTSGKQTLHELYVGASGDWAYTEKEVWAYTDANLTLHEKYTGDNGALVGIEKEEWEHTGNPQPNHTNYMWFSNDWYVESRQAYDAADHQILFEDYAIVSDKYKGTKKEEYTFNTAGQQTDKKVYKWVSNKWSNDTWDVARFDEAGNKIENCKYKGSGTKWNVTGTRTLKTFDSNNREIERILQKAKNGEWKDDSRVTISYVGDTDKKLLVIDYEPSDGDWEEVSKTDFHYDDLGREDWNYVYAKSGDEWINSSRTIYTFDSKGNNILTKEDYWLNEEWVMSSIKKWDIILDSENNTLLSAMWECETDGVWKGLKKDTAAYSATGKKIYEAHYASWSDGWIGSSDYEAKIEWNYDDADRLIMRQSFYWNNGGWHGRKKAEYGYDAQGNQIMTATYLSWNAAASKWIGSRKHIYEYNASGKMTKDITFFWEDGDWQYDSSESYEFDASGRETLHLIQNYDESGWVNVSKVEKGYRGSTLVKDNSYSWKSGQWVIYSQNEQYFDNDLQAKLRREIVGSWSSGVVQSFADDHYFYHCDPHFFTVRFRNDDGTMLQIVENVPEGDTPAYTGATPTKQGNAQYTYTFKGWDKTIVPAASDATYTATYNQIVNKYLITFANEDGTTIEAKEWEYGATPVAPAAPTKPATAEYTYSFAGWGKEIVAVTGEETYTATFTTGKVMYTVNFKNGDDLLQSSQVEYGATPQYNGATPTKQADAQYTYTFIGWDKDIAPVTTHVTYSATFNSTINKYTITFKNGETVLQSGEVAYGETPTYTGATPVKAADAQYTYTFKGWDKTVAAVTGAATYNAVFNSETNKYLITFKNGDKVLQSTEVAYGETPKYNGATPTKAGDAQYTYTFKGWDKDIVAVIGAATYSATFSSKVNSYTITWLNDDNSLIGKTAVEYGKTPTHADASKANTAEWVYTFTGWSPTIVAVTGDATYKATFSQVAQKYTITFYNEDGVSVLDQQVLAYGEFPVYQGDEPTKSSTAEFSYEFKGWQGGLCMVTGDADYTATFTSTKNKYTITWLNDDNTQIDQTSVEYGVVPAHADPTKSATAEWTYTFTGWDKTLVAVTGDATYKATFSSTKNKYTITWLNDDNTQIDQTSVEYGVVPTHADPIKAATAEWTYTFSGWDKTPVVVTGDATYKATFSSTKNKYTITWLNDDNTQIDQTSVEYDVVPTHADPTKAATAEWTYTFAGWDKTPVAVTGDATYKATYSSTKNKYTITWLNDDNTQIDQTSVEYGVVPTHADPTKAATAEWTYTFSGWDKTTVAVTGDATYKATFNAAKNKYTITWLNDDNTQIDQTSVEYGVVPTHADPTKAATAEWTYTFAGWDKTPVAVTGDATYKATFNAAKNSYTITWLNDDNTLINKTSVEYGVVPTHADPTKSATAEWTYTFAGWDKTPVAVTGDATYKATFSAAKNSYTITWLNDDNSLIDVTTVAYGEVPEHEDATKSANAQYTYSFKGWSPAVTAVTGVATYTAEFDSVVNAYTITWLNDDNSLIDETTVAYGEVPEHEDATKAANAQYTYTFKSWSPQVATVTGVATYTAEFDSVVNTYTITWLNDDNSLIDETTVAYGELPEHEDATKSANAQYTYSFKGWSPAVTAVTGVATYTAEYDSVVNTYTITWLNDDNSLIDETTVAYGEVPEHEDATKAANAQYTYTFKSWSPAVTAVTGVATYTAEFDSVVNTYTITWLNDDNSLIDETTVAYGEVPEHEDATKAANAQYTYTFKSWSPAVTAVTGVATYTAEFDSVVNQYMITFLNEDGTTIEANEWEYGVVPVAPDDPSKDATAQYTYTFAGWDKEVVAVEGDAIYTATFDSIVNTYTITWLDDDDQLIDETEVAYGELPSHADAEKESDAQYTYTFAGWTPEIVAVTGEATYKATYTTEVNTYEITFEVKDNPEMTYTISDVPYGTELSVLIELVKEALGGDTYEDERYIYTFAGLEGVELTDIVTSDATYYVLYTVKEKQTPVDDTRVTIPVTKIIRDDHVYIIREGKTYSIEGIEMR